MNKVPWKLPWLRNGWWALIPLVLAVMVAGLAISSGTQAGTAPVPPSTFENEMTVCAQDAVPSLPGWDWERHWDLDPVTIEGPIHLR